MADPRFFDNRGPFTLAELCAKLGASVPEGADASAPIADVAGLSGAVAAHLTFFTGERPVPDFLQSKAGFCLVSAKAKDVEAPAGMVRIVVSSVEHAFAAACEAFYPDSNRLAGPLQSGIDPTAKIGAGVEIAPSVVVGPGVEIGDGTRLGPNTVIGRGVCIGRNCDVAGNTMITCAYIGDSVLILPGAQIGQPGFRFASNAQGHAKVPQLGRVIVQDRVEIGACTTIDRGGLGDTVVGEGTKIDNLVQIGHNTHIGRHCVIVSQVGISGSSEIGDFVILAGQVGLSDHVKIGSGARIAGQTGLIRGQVVEPGKDMGGTPGKPLKDWIREVHAVNALIKKPKRAGNDG